MPAANLDPYRKCLLCPRNCGADRLAGRRGVCGEGAECRVSYCGPHHGEEPSFSGTKGSGTIFFCGCSSHCFFCQNVQISSSDVEGRILSPEGLLVEARRLAGSGVHNLNFVSPDHFWPHIKYLCESLRSESVKIPFLYNCSGYQSPALIPEIAELIDIFMPDFKFAEPGLAKYCMGDASYPELALSSLHEMVKAKGFLRPFGTDGETVAEKGVLVRHLVLPGQVSNSLAVLDILHREFGADLPLSVMSQYRPMAACRGRGDFARGLLENEYDAVCERVCELGFENVYVQELSPETAFLPDFRQNQPFGQPRE